MEYLCLPYSFAVFSALVGTIAIGGYLKSSSKDVLLINFFMITVSFTFINAFALDHFDYNVMAIFGLFLLSMVCQYFAFWFRLKAEESKNDFIMTIICSVVCIAIAFSFYFLREGIIEEIALHFPSEFILWFAITYFIIPTLFLAIGIILINLLLKNKRS
jgi:hypothetical protein